jgi:hypothetical protein
MRGTRSLRQSAADCNWVTFSGPRNRGSQASRSPKQRKFVRASGASLLCASHNSALYQRLGFFVGTLCLAPENPNKSKTAGNRRYINNCRYRFHGCEGYASRGTSHSAKGHRHPRALTALRMTFDTCQASDLAVGSDPWTLAAAKTFLAARALIVLGLAGMVGPCGCWCHAATPAAKTSGGSHTSSPQPNLVRSSVLNKYTGRSV